MFYNRFVVLLLDTSLIIVVFLGLLTGGVLLLILLSRFFQEVGRPSSLHPYDSKPLLTKTEQRFFLVLREVVPRHYLIFAQVRLADLVKVRPGTPLFRKFLFQVTNKSIDFVICDPKTLNVVLALELDDSTHQLGERRKRDVLVNNIFQAAKISLVRWPVQRVYSSDKLRATLRIHFQVSHPVKQNTQIARR